MRSLRVKRAARRTSTEDFPPRRGIRNVPEPERLSASGELGQQAETLRGDVASFLAAIKAA